MKKIVRPIKTLIRQISLVKNIVCSKIRILFHHSTARKSLYSYNNNYYIYGSVLVNEMPKSARYHIDRANSIVLPQKGCHYSLFHPRGMYVASHCSTRVIYDYPIYPGSNTKTSISEITAKYLIKTF